MEKKTVENPQCGIVAESSKYKHGASLLLATYMQHHKMWLVICCNIAIRQVMLNLRMTWIQNSLVFPSPHKPASVTPSAVITAATL